MKIFRESWQTLLCLYSRRPHRGAVTRTVHGTCTRRNAIRGTDGNRAEWGQMQAQDSGVLLRWRWRRGRSLPPPSFDVSTCTSPMPTAAAVAFSPPSPRSRPGVSFEPWREWCRRLRDGLLTAAASRSPSPPPSAAGSRDLRDRCLPRTSSTSPAPSPAPAAGMGTPLLLPGPASASTLAPPSVASFL